MARAPVTRTLEVSVGIKACCMTAGAEAGDCVDPKVIREMDVAKACDRVTLGTGNISTGPAVAALCSRRASSRSTSSCLLSASNRFLSASSCLLSASSCFTAPSLTHSSAAFADNCVWSSRRVFWKSTDWLTASSLSASTCHSFVLASFSSLLRHALSSSQMKAAFLASCRECADWFSCARTCT